MSDTEYRKRAAEFNEKMDLSDPDDYWEDALIRFTVIAEESGELFQAVNKNREELPEELADIVITCYTGADTLDIELPEEFEPSNTPPSLFEDIEREESSWVFVAAGKVFTAMARRDKEEIKESMKTLLQCCHHMADKLDINIGEEYDKKMDYNMQKSGAKVNGKPVDDVE